jgi:pimeloyl-ACP methyl ester carboxylesterase
VIIWIAIGWVTTLPIAAQTVNRVELQGKDPFNFYLEWAPQNQAQHLLVLLPGFGQGAETVWPETQLINIASLHGIHTIVLNNGFHLYPDRQYQRYLNTAIEQALTQHQIPRDQVAIGGFSAGGTIALRYVERMLANPKQFPAHPAAVFTVDSPVDLFELWDYCEREAERNFSPEGVAEAQFVLRYLKNQLKGTPETAYDRYALHTPFNRAQDSLGNERYLRFLPVRCYHDLDITWQIENRRRDLYDNNAAPASSFILALRRAGNAQAEFILASQPGYRANGSRHPHAWSIIDEVECITWLLASYQAQADK